MYVYCAGCGNLIPGLGTPDTFGLGVGTDYRYSHGHGYRSGIAVFIPDNKGGCGEGGWVVFSDIGHLSGGSEKSGFAGRRFGNMLFTIHGFGV